MLTQKLKEYARTIPADLKEKKGVYTLEFTVAERKVFLSRKKLTYSAKFRVDEEKKELKFTEMLRESSSGMTSGDSDFGPGFGFKKETFKTGTGPRESIIEQQSELFGKTYNYVFDFKTIRGVIDQLATKEGYTFTYMVTPVGL